MTDRPPTRVAVIGGGISGLAAAHRLRELYPHVDVVLFEASDRLGGVLETLTDGDLLIERSADSFLTRLPWAMDLCRRIGLGEQLLETEETRRRALVVRRGRLLPVPEGFVMIAPRRLWPIVTTPVLGPWGKLRLACEPLIRRRLTPSTANDVNSDESVGSFVRRRMGKQTLERLVQPLLSGIYTGDVERLSIAATMPEFLRYESDYGSVLRGLRASPGAERSVHNTDAGARYSLFVAPRLGMTQLVNTLAAQLPPGSIRLNAAVRSVSATPAGEWRLNFDSSAPAETFAGVVLAIPAHRARKLLENVDAELSRELAAIEYESSAVVSLVYRRDQIAHPLDAFGFVVPKAEQRSILAASFSSMKFSGRTAEGDVLIRVFFGGALQPEMLENDDAKLQSIAEAELAQLLGARGGPRLADVARWPRAMPQYHVGHVARVARIEERMHRHKGLQLAGNAFRGVGIPQCIRSGEQAAERIVTWLGRADVSKP